MSRSHKLFAFDADDGKGLKISDPCEPEAWIQSPNTVEPEQ